MRAVAGELVSAGTYFFNMPCNGHASGHTMRVLTRLGTRPTSETLQNLKPDFGKALSDLLGPPLLPHKPAFLVHSLGLQSTEATPSREKQNLFGGVTAILPNSLLDSFTGEAPSYLVSVRPTYRRLPGSQIALKEH